MFRVIASARVWTAGLLARRPHVRRRGWRRPGVGGFHAEADRRARPRRVRRRLGLERRERPASKDAATRSIAPANPLRGVGRRLRLHQELLAQIRGPIVLVGHSYGGIVITNAATGNPNVKALVYIAAFAPARATPSELDRRRSRAVGPARWTSGPPRTRTARRAGGLHQARRVPRHLRRRPAAKLARDMAPRSGPPPSSTLGEPSGPPAWKTIPSYYMVAGADKAIGADNERRWPSASPTRRSRQGRLPRRDDLAARRRLWKLIADAAAGRR